MRIVFALILAGCSSSHLVGGTEASGYLGGDVCNQLGSESACNAAGGCAWLVPPCPAGATCPAGVCYAPDPCLKIADAATCNADSRCAWSEAATLCPVGADCASGGYCHPKDPSGGSCGCVTPLACPAGSTCPPPECDCSGGSGGSGGGSCTCACPPCAPGEACPPCACDCSGTGCVTGGTCVCACPDCAPGQDCPPCACGCGSTGPVPAPTGTTSNDPSMGGPGDPCSAFTDANTCTANSGCQWFASGQPCMTGQTCVSGVCQTEMPPPPTGCGCACPTCAPGTACPPCDCNCTDPSGGCTPPAPPTGGGGTVCPAIGCASPCPNGTKTGADGCPTCECL
jgi:hypothetical protein